MAVDSSQVEAGKVPSPVQRSFRMNGNWKPNSRSQENFLPFLIEIIGFFSFQTEIYSLSFSFFQSFSLSLEFGRGQETKNDRLLLTRKQTDEKVMT